MDRRTLNLAAAAAIALLAAGRTLPTLAQSQAVGHGEGEVRKIDRDQGKVTLRHGPIAEWNMPGMTMIFRVKDTRMLDQVKEGQAVRFATVRESGAMWLQSIEPK